MIDVSCFVPGPEHIENVSVAEMPLPQSLAVNEAINGYIKVFQPELLRNVVGVALSQAIADHLEPIEREKGDSSNEVDISEEKEEPQPGYVISCERLCEPFTNYILCHILRDVDVQATITRPVRLKYANEYVVPLKRQVSTWNSMVERNEQFVEWTMSNDCPFDVKITKNLLTPINAFNL